MPHKDGAAYHPVVCTVSLGSSLCLEVYDTKDNGTTENKPKWKIVQEPRSLLITTGEIYTDYLHGIAEVEEEVDVEPTNVSNWELLRSTEDIIDGRNNPFLFWPVSWISPEMLLPHTSLFRHC